MINSVKFGKINVYKAWIPEDGRHPTFQIGVTNEGHTDKHLFRDAVVEADTDDTAAMGGLEAPEWKFTVSVIGDRVAGAYGHNDRPDYVTSFRLPPERSTRLLAELVRQPVAAGTYPTLDINA